MNIDEEALAMQLSFHLGYYMAKGLMENYPHNFNKMIKEMAHKIAENKNKWLEEGD